VAAPAADAIGALFFVSARGDRGGSAFSSKTATGVARGGGAAGDGLR
jgi:hypothetical protein